MSPVLHLLAGPNGAGKSTFAEHVLIPVMHLPFVNADEIAAENWPGAEELHAYEAAKLAAHERERLLSSRSSFITETVFSHPSKVVLLRRASMLKYQVNLHIMMVSLEQSLARVSLRMKLGGHSVPAEKIASRYSRLWEFVAEARKIADTTRIYDNSVAKNPFRLVAEYTHGVLDYEGDWPAWTPRALR